MAKAPARLNDEVSNDIHGNGHITSGNSSVIFEGQPVACAGDTVRFQDQTEGVIKEGAACVVISGRRLALIADSTEQDGTLCNGAGTIQVDEGNPFIFIGPNVSIEKNVIFSCKSEPLIEVVEELEYYYAVEHEDGTSANFAYRLDSNQEKIYQGKLDSNNSTSAFPISKKGEPIFWIPQS